MDHVYISFSGMAFNVFLAVIPVAFGWIFFKSRSKFIKYSAGFIWFFFLPNTIYLLTDIVNSAFDSQSFGGIYLVVTTTLYLIVIPIGVVTYILSIYPFEKMIPKKSVVGRPFAIFILNLFVAFGVVLGRLLRVNSWEIVTNTPNVIYKSLQIVTSIEFLEFVVGFAILFQLIYIFFRKDIYKQFGLK